MKFAQIQMKHYYDRKRTEARDYQIGDLVWLEGTNITTDRPTKKLEDRRYGPFKILEKIGPSAYKLNIPRKWKGIHPVVNEAVLTPYIRPQFKSQTQNPPPVPDVVTPEGSWEIEEIIDSKEKKPGEIWYLVHWKDHPRSERQWVKRAEVLKSAPEAVSAYHKRFPDNPRPGLIKIPPVQRTVQWRKPFSYTDHLLRPFGQPPLLYDWKTRSLQFNQSRGRDSWRGGNVTNTDRLGVLRMSRLTKDMFDFLFS